MGLGYDLPDQTNSNVRLSCDLGPYLQGVTEKPVVSGRFSLIFQAKLSNKLVAVKKIRALNFEAQQIQQVGG